ncbi:hypothetical protein B6U71_01175 [Euryarchaeota archaeon ex4484_178]|nr:MAG: hypothetical protein B6U71_01175 [Euryarchaeota archaeon ex4484_178]
MKEKELKEIAANYFGFTQTVRLPENLDVEVIYPDSLEADVEAAKKIKIKWENHIGSKSGVSRITPLDIMHHLHV